MFFFLFYSSHRCPVCREWIGSRREIRMLFLMSTIGEELRALRTNSTVGHSSHQVAPRQRCAQPSNRVAVPQRITHRRVTIGPTDHPMDRPRRICNQTSTFNYIRCSICNGIMPSFNNNNVCFMCCRQIN